MGWAANRRSRLNARPLGTGGASSSLIRSFFRRRASMHGTATRCCTKCQASPPGTPSSRCARCWRRRGAGSTTPPACGARDGADLGGCGLHGRISGVGCALVVGYADCRQTATKSAKNDAIVANDCRAAERLELPAESVCPCSGVTVGVTVKNATPARVVRHAGLARAAQCHAR